MKKGKFQSSTTRHIRGSSRTIALILAVVLLMGGVIGGTVAWLVDETDAVVNTFTYGDINITLDETKLDENGNPTDDRTTTGNNYPMVPGGDLNKDPKVTVKAGSEASYLFVKLVKEGGATVGETTYTFDDYLTYAIADGWTELEAGVYYREVEKNAEAQEFFVLKDNKITVKGSVTKEMLNALDADANAKTYPTLTITAYAVQKDNIPNAADAWKVANGEEFTPAESEPAASESANP